MKRGLIALLVCLLLLIGALVYQKSQERKPFFQIIDNGDTFTLIHEP